MSFFITPSTFDSKEELASAVEGGEDVRLTLVEINGWAKEDLSLSSGIKYRAVSATDGAVKIVDAHGIEGSISLHLDWSFSKHRLVVTSDAAELIFVVNPIF